MIYSLVEMHVDMPQQVTGKTEDKTKPI